MTAPDCARVVPVGPALRWLLRALYLLTGLLTATAAYLGGVTAAELATGNSYQGYVYQWTVLVHLGVGVVVVLPFLIFAPAHALAARAHPNRRAARMGYVLAALGLVVLASGLGLMRVAGIDLRQPGARAIVYWAHVLAPFGAAWAFVNHRRRGRALAPRAAWTWAAATTAVVALTAAIDVRTSRAPVGEATVSLAPSFARTAGGRAIPSAALMNDDYCAECHTDAHRGWLSSAHRFSSFNNEVYKASVKETREVMLARDGNVDGSRWCAGCHDPVPLFSGAFGRADFDIENDPTARAGLTCTACHAIEQVNSTRGNGDYTIGEPRHYPFAFSTSPALREVSKQLIKAKPAFHKATFLKPMHRTAEFCSTCHKVHIPGRAQRLQGVPARTEPLRQLHPERRVGPRRPQLLLPAQGRSPLRRLPHAAAPVARLRRAAVRRQRRAADPRPPLRGGQHRRVAPARRRRDRQGAASLPRQGRDPRYLRSARRRHDRRDASSARSAPRRRRSRPGSSTSSSGPAHTQGRPPLHSGHGRLERSLGRGHRPRRRRG